MIETAILARAGAVGSKDGFLSAIRRVVDAPLPPFYEDAPVDETPLEDLIDERVGK